VLSASILYILADETRDVSGIEQLTICIRLVDTNLLVHEDLRDVSLIAYAWSDSEGIGKMLEGCPHSMPAPICRSSWPRV